MHWRRQLLLLVFSFLNDFSLDDFGSFGDRLLDLVLRHLDFLNLDGFVFGFGDRGGCITFRGGGLGDCASLDIS